jgi:hypothetical protein
MNVVLLTEQVRFTAPPGQPKLFVPEGRTEDSPGEVRGGGSTPGKAPIKMEAAPEGRRESNPSLPPAFMRLPC